jgi:hypothetical protein
MSLPLTPPSAHEAKKAIRAILAAHNLTNKLSAKVVSISQLGKDVRVVTIWDWKPSPIWDEIERASFKGGFLVTSRR